MSGHHIAPVRSYFLVFAALIIGTGLTYAAALVDFGFFNNVVMLAIALAKARSSSSSSWACAGARA